jgi:hypothetical protein
MKNINMNNENSINICTYENKNIIPTLSDILPSNVKTVEPNNYPEFIKVVESIEKMANTLPVLYILCAQYQFSDVFMYCCYKTSTLTPLRELILCRLLLNLDHLGKAERRAIHFICKHIEKRISLVGELDSNKSYYFVREAFNNNLHMSIEKGETLESLREQGIDISCYYDTIVYNLNKFDQEFIELLVIQNEEYMSE